MTKYEVKAEAGVDVNGTHYDAGHIFEFDAVPEYVQSLIDDASILEVLEAQGTKNAPADEEVGNTENVPKDEGADSSASSENDSSAQTQQSDAAEAGSTTTDEVKE
jgi:hypothetical protein